VTHKELCIATAKRFINQVALIEYKSSASAEEPDVLVYGYQNTILYEIKMSRSDFLADQKKECRKKGTMHYTWQLEKMAENDPVVKRAYIRWQNYWPEVFIKQAPHLGSKRYYVCEWGLIKPEEIPEHWGLYWYRSGKFYIKKESSKFRVNMKDERDLLIHALRRWANGLDQPECESIIIKKY
jgi:hypothetical protein